MSCDTERTLTVLVTVVRLNCCPCVLLLSGKGCAHADRGPKDNNKGTVLFLLEKVVVLGRLVRGTCIVVV
jgi:hypothetical protein